MPSINLRLTDEQHAELERWAHDGHRSLQKEIIWRLFSNYPVPTYEDERIARALPERAGGGDAAPSHSVDQGRASNPAARSESDEVKPDWKTGKKK